MMEVRTKKNERLEEVAERAVVDWCMQKYR